MQPIRAIAGTRGIGIFSGIVLGTGNAVNCYTLFYIRFQAQTLGVDDRKQNTVKKPIGKP
jgi:hypothetical protein